MTSVAPESTIASSPVPSIHRTPSTLSVRSQITVDGSQPTIFQAPTDTLTARRSPPTSSAPLSGSPSGEAAPRTRPPLCLPPSSMAESFLSPIMMRTPATFTSADDSALSPSIAGGQRYVPPSRSSSLRRTTRMTDLDREYEPTTPRYVATFFQTPVNVY